MNRIELCIFGGGIGILAGCGPAPVPIIDASFYPAEKGAVAVLSRVTGTETVQLDAGEYRALEECAYRKGKFYLVGHEILCDEGKPKIEPKDEEKKKERKKKRSKVACDCTDKPREKKNNGWGNGDQAAPGKSLAHNNAENNKKGKAHRNHGKAKPN